MKTITGDPGVMQGETKSQFTILHTLKVIQSPKSTPKTFAPKAADCKDCLAVCKKCSPRTC